MMPHAQIRMMLATGAALVSVVLLTGAESRRSSSSPKTPVRAASGSPAAAAVAPTQGYEAFSLVVERNIFNPNRVGRTRSSDEKAARVDEVSLVGTIQHGPENLALFDSSDAALRKAVHEGDTLGEFKVQRITAAGVDLQRGETPFSLKVAQQLRRVEGGDWAVATNQAARLDPRALTAPDPASKPVEAITSSAELPADASEVLKRLMKKREKQLNK